MSKKQLQKKTRGKRVKELDAVFSKYIRLISSDKHWFLVCPLCNTRLHRKRAQNMHFISRAVYKYRWDEKNCNAWCYRCNVALNWNYIVYTRYMQKKLWMLAVDEMINDKQIVKIPTAWIIEQIEHYKKIVKTLESKLIANEKPNNK